MELLISEIVVRVLYRETCIVMQMIWCKKHLLFYAVIFDKKTEYRINPQMTKTELVPPNKTKSTTNDMHRITGKREAISWSCYFKNGFCLTISANNL